MIRLLSVLFVPVNKNIKSLETRLSILGSVCLMKYYLRTERAERTDLRTELERQEEQRLIAFGNFVLHAQTGGHCDTLSF